ncbi:MAG: ComEC/Rec2 family competence protein [Planctomycetota bacterium]|nr:ComEC/Rec2 family competence protein [Planctomycetota bacterium]
MPRRMGGHKATQHAFLPWIAGAMVAGAASAGIAVGLVEPIDALDERGRLILVTALITVAIAAHGIALAWRRWSFVSALCLMIAAAAFGAFRVAEENQEWQALLKSLGVVSVQLEASHIANPIRKLVCVEGIVVSTPRIDEFAYRDELMKCDSLEEDTLARFVPRTPSTRFDLEIDSFLDSQGNHVEVFAKIRVIVDGSVAGCVAGDRVRTKGLLSGFELPTNPGGFNSVAWSQMRGIAGLLSIPSEYLIEQQECPLFCATSFLARWRSYVDANLQDALGDQSRLDATALVAASTTGANWPGLRSVSKAFAASGVQHLVAISGFNFGILAACALWSIRRMRLAPRIGGVVLVVLAILFIASIESEVSSIRAAFMGGTTAIALSVGRSMQFGSLIGLTAMILVAFDPLTASQPGFQLSFGAIFGLRYIAPIVARWLSCAVRGYGLLATILRRAFEPLAAGISAWIATTPIVALHFGVCSLWCVPCTIALSPSFAVMIISSNIAVAAQPVCPPIGFVAGWVSVVNARMILCVVRFCATLPGALDEGSSVKTITDVADWRTRIDMIDVGNGSCYLIRSGASAVLFDCGSLGSAAVGSQTVVPAMRALGVRSLDTVVISHPNLDHYGALPEVVRAFSVRRVFVTPQFIRWARHGAAHEALRAAQMGGATIEEFSRGDEHKFGFMCWRALHPPAKSFFADSNDGSLIIRISDGGFALLLVGDAAREACHAVLESSLIEDLRGITVFELPHHGSFRPDAAALAMRVASPIVLQSTGPNRLVKDRWGAILVNTQRLVTARDRACAVLWKNDGMIWIGRWTGLRYEWCNSGIWRDFQQGIKDIDVVESQSSNTTQSPTNSDIYQDRSAQDDRIANGTAGSFLDLDFEWAVLNRDTNTRFGIFCVERKTREFLAVLANDECAIGPTKNGWWNFYIRAEHGKALGDFVDEPFRPPDLDCGCAKRSFDRADDWCWIFRAREKYGGWSKNFWLDQ